MKRTKYLPNGTTYNLTVATTIYYVGGSPRNYPVGTPAVITGHKRETYEYREMVYKLQLPDGAITTAPTAEVHRAIAPHLGTTADYGRPSFSSKNW
jgi:hypothetical protein